jgi:signal transduction histidine kinase
MITVAGETFQVRLWRSVAEAQGALDEFRDVLLLMIPAFLAISVAGGWFLSRRALRPVAPSGSIARGISRIVANDSWRVGGVDRGVIESLLELTRADSGPVLSLLPLDVRAIVLEVRSHAESMATQSGVQLRLAVTKDPVFVMGDKIALRRALLALIGNAIKFTPPSGQVRVTLSIRSGDVLFEVEDNGIGIAKEDLSRIFDRFYQVDRSRSGGGVGLGLSIAHWIAQEHGGRIEVESEIARGAIFRLVLPVSAETR